MENTQASVWAAKRHIKPLNKKFIKDFLFMLRHTSYCVFTLFKHLPEDQFRIGRYYDYREARADYSYKISPDIYTLGEFYKQIASFHKKDEFYILFGQDTLYYENELTLNKITVLAERFLQEQCEKGLRENKPILLTRELIRKYRLKKIDMWIVSMCLDKCNSAAISKIQAEYDTLKLLDCITK